MEKISYKHFGRIRNKYHVIEIFRIAFIISDACYFMFNSSRKLRNIIIENFKIMNNQRTEIDKIPVLKLNLNNDCFKACLKKIKNSINFKFPSNQPSIHFFVYTYFQIKMCKSFFLFKLSQGL